MQCYVKNPDHLHGTWSPGLTPTTHELLIINRLHCYILFFSYISLV